MPAFTNIEDNLWISTPRALGPFTGLQGGAVAGLMAHELERMADAQNLGQAVAASINFLRPTPPGKLHTSPQVLRQGSRVSVLENSIFHDDVLTAKATVSFIQPVSMPNVNIPARQSYAPLEARLVEPQGAFHGQSWMMDNFEARHSDDGIAWFRYTDEIVTGMSPLARILGPADWTHGIDRPQHPKLADPNINLNLVACRLAQGEFIGIRPEAVWLPNGIATGYGELVDDQGPFGHVMMSVALISFS